MGWLTQAEIKNHKHELLTKEVLINCQSCTTTFNNHKLEISYIFKKLKSDKVLQQTKQTTLFLPKTNKVFWSQILQNLKGRSEKDAIKEKRLSESLRKMFETKNGD